MALYENVLIIFMIPFLVYTIFTKEFKLLFLGNFAPIFLGIVELVGRGRTFPLVTWIFIVLFLTLSVVMFIFFRPKNQNAENAQKRKGRVRNRRQNDRY